ncbi:hypothetical protein DFH06DRAFT_1473430 [Mycena polygramma]|nr:hypothetical protein DFH06DRAFT_1473430 [Mycena polygramma]
MPVMLATYPELILEILDMLDIPLAFDTDQFPNREPLLACSLVCKSWSTYSQRLLFRRVRIDNEWSGMFAMSRAPTVPPASNIITSFLETITGDTEKSRWLAQSVLSLNLHPYIGTKSADIVSILTNLPNLRELDITRVACRFSDAELSQLRNSGANIRSLCISTDNTGPITSMGPPVWPGLIKLIAALPTIRMLTIAANTARNILPHTTAPPLGLELVSFKFKSKWVADPSAFIASLTRGRTDGGALQLYSHAFSDTPVKLHGVLSAHGSNLRSLSLPGKVDEPHILALCTCLERFECRTLPSDDLVAAIPRMINALAVRNLNPDPDPAPPFPIPREDRFPPPKITPISVAQLTLQLDTFPNLRVFTWVGSIIHPGFNGLRDRCVGLGVEFRARVLNSLSDDAIQFALRRELLQL